MNILHVIPGVAPRYGGPSSVIFRIVGALNLLPGVRAEIATTDADGVGSRITYAELRTDVPVHMFRRTWSEQWKVSIGLQRWLRRHITDYDIVHIHALWSSATAMAGRTAQRRMVPYILRPAGMLSEYSWNYNGWKKRIYWTLIESHTAVAATAFHVTSQAEANDVRAVRPDARVFNIPNGVEPAAFSTPRDATTLRQRCGPAAADKPIVLFLSRLHPVKGIVDRLLPAVAAMRSTCFLAIAGAEDSHSPGHEAAVRATIRQLGLENRVALLGPVMGDERWSLFDGAAAFVLPSHSENFGIVVAEAMARGCPVVVTDGVQASVHVSAAGAGLVVPGDVAALASALDSVLADSQIRKTYSEAGTAYAQEHFRWEKIAEQVRQMYLECLAAN